MLPLPNVVPPDPDALLRAISDQLDDRDLIEIARADWGEDARAHLKELLRIARQGHVPRPMAWEPREVLELTRWTEPDPAWGRDRLVQVHWQRAFACTALLRAFGEPENHKDFCGHNQTAIQLIASLRFLGGGLDAEAAAFFAWLIPRLPEDENEEHPFYGLGLLWFALAPSVGSSDEVLLALMDWIMLGEDAVAGRYRESYGASPTGPWLLALTYHNLRHEVWKAFGTWLVERLGPQHGAAVTEGIQLLRAMLDPSAAENSDEHRDGKASKGGSG